MRLLLLVLNVVVSMSLLTNTSEVLAVSADSKGKEQNQYHTYIKGKAPNNSGDVWERIRLGMKITRPSSTQVLSKQTLIPEKTQSERLVPPKYINQPHTAIAPLNNYTTLGLRLRFGTPLPSLANDNCIPLISTRAQQEQTLKPKNNDSINAESHTQLPRRAALPTPISGILPAKSAMTDTLAQTTNNPTPCIKRTNQYLVGVNKQGKQRDIAEQNNIQKTMINERINKYITLFSQNPSYLYQVAERAHPYLYHIVEGLSKNQMPLELALLPIVESAYQPAALSSKGAAGLWQFIPGTGKDYGLKQNNQYDERLDILASTQAAIHYLSDLKNHFNGDWLLALAAYNCGQRTIDNAISRNLSDGLDIDYWSLRLPEETQEYIPRLLALSNIFASPEIYGLKFPPIKNEPYFVKVKIDREGDIKHLTNKSFAILAKLINLSHQQFKLLNPGYLNPTLLPKSEYTFLLPLANASQLNRLLTSIAHFMAEPLPSSVEGDLKSSSSTTADLNESTLISIKL